ncbi:MAG: hypothetical protein WCC37_16760 [Candidatus Sulfotelmatobacter sp.]
MPNSFKGLLWKQFAAERDNYLKIVREVERTKGEIAKTGERLELLSRLLALEGKTVTLPTEVVIPKRKIA